MTGQSCPLAHPRAGVPGYGSRVRQTLAPGDFVAAALAIVDESGLDALNTRALGERLGVHPTAVYRHFHDWDALRMAVADELIGRMAAVAMPAAASCSTPREILALLANALRDAVLARPELAGLLMSILEAEWVVPTPNADAVTLAVVEQLRSMGLSGEQLVTAHQAYESALVGSILVDFAGHPRHLAHRRVRRQTVPVPEFATGVGTNDAVDATNARAAALTLDALLDRFEQMAAQD